MKTAIYPGSFNPWHDGHFDVLDKALQVFDKVNIVVMVNPAKDSDDYRDLTNIQNTVDRWLNTHNLAGKATVSQSHSLLVDLIAKSKRRPDAVIRGLRNGQDFEYERIQQYWNEDLGINIPTIYFVSDRKLVHISSSAIRIVEGLKK